VTKTKELKKSPLRDMEEGEENHPDSFGKSSSFRPGAAEEPGFEAV